MIYRLNYRILRRASDLLKVLAAMIVMFLHYCNVKAAGGGELNSVEWLIFSKYQPAIKIPLILAAVTFDIYLVHFKVLTVILESYIGISLWLFIISTAVAAVGFYCLRTRLLKL